MIAFSASTTGAGGTRVRPAPNRAVRSRTEPEFTRWVIVDPPPRRCDPNAVEPSRLDPRVTVESGASVPAAVLGVLSGTPVEPAPAGDPQTSQ